jgi:hypothetical protein
MNHLDLEDCTRFFMWGSILNAGLMTITTFLWMFFRSRAHAIHARIFGVSSVTVDIAAYAYLGIWKALTLVFFICPWLALLILA